jgi:integrase
MNTKTLHRRGPAVMPTDAQVRAVLALAAKESFPQRSIALLRLSVTLALRVSDLSGLEWRDVLTSSGEVSDTLIIRPETAKYGSGTKLPIPAQAKKAVEDLLAWETTHHGKPSGNQPLFRSQRGFMKRQSMVMWFRKIYSDAGATGCSSHSNRRYGLTKMARQISLAGGSIRDIQSIARHASLQTTEKYLALSHEAQSNVIAMLDKMMR